MSNRLIMFVCTGDVCRSPMAEHLLRDRLGPDPEWKVCSAGLSAGYGQPASQAAIEALKEHGIDMSSHRSRPVTRELIDAASIVVVMTAAHRDQIRTFYPDAVEKVFLIKSFDSTASRGDIDDPIGLSAETYSGIRNEIEATLPGLISFLECFEV